MGNMMDMMDKRNSNALKAWGGRKSLGSLDITIVHTIHPPLYIHKADVFLSGGSLLNPTILKLGDRYKPRAFLGIHGQR
jgi:hypothetical protein